MSAQKCALMIVCFCISAVNASKSQAPSQERYNFFDTEIFKVLSLEERRNLLISPVCIKLLLGILVEGADGNTAEEIRAALRLPKEKEAARLEFDSWLSLLQVEESPNHLKIASHLFVADHLNIKEEYRRTLEAHYMTGVTTVAFDEPKETSRTINSWVEHQTSDFIKGIVDESQISADTGMMLTSALYFKGLWMNPFTKEKNRIGCFYTMGNECIKTPLMTDTGYFNFGYISQLDAQAIQLPYKNNKHFMLILLPAKRNGAGQLSRDLVHVTLSSILLKIRQQEVVVQIPPFEISYESDLVNALKKLQLSDAFSQYANFSKIFMSNDSAAVTHFLHSARITVNEEGNEAAAVGGALFVPLMGGTTTTFIADHPFLFFIMDSLSHSVLFAGKLLSPQDSRENSINTFGAQAAATPSKAVHQRSANSHNTIPPHSIDPSSTTTTTSPLVKSLRQSTQTPMLRSIKGMFPLYKTSRPQRHPMGSAYFHSTGQRDDPSGQVSVDKFLSGDKIPKSLSAHRLMHHKFVKDDNPRGRPQNMKNRTSTSDGWRHHTLFFT